MRVTLPLTYWADYSERFDDRPRVVAQRGRMAVIEATPAQLDHLRADAAHYASDAMDDCPAWLRRSARAATLHLSRS